jgi:hypothetical protein
MDGTGVLHLAVIARPLACRPATPPPHRTTNATHRLHSTEQRTESNPQHAAPASGATAPPGTVVFRPPIASGTASLVVRGKTGEVEESG